MNEKTKRILSYVACTFGGVALGIALLGGLSYCSVSEKAEQNEVNTILTKRNAKTTNPTNGITSYTFKVTSEQYRLEQGTYRFKVYDVDTTNYDLTQVAMADSVAYIGTGFNAMTQAITTLYTNMTPSSTNVRFISIEGYSEIDEGALVYWTYFSFISSHTPTLSLKPFILKNYANPIWHLNSYASANATSYEILINSSKSDHIIYKRSSPNAEGFTYNFQDAASYYQLLGWESGYESGDNVGYWAGYNDGVGTAGNFTNISGNVNAVIDLAPLGVSTQGGYSHGLTDTKYYSLLQFRDQDQESWTVEIEDGIASDQPTGTRTAYLNLYSPNEGYKGWIGYAVRDSSLTTFSVQKINTFTFEFATVYNVLGRSLTDQYVLIWGWASDNVSYQAGYNAGYADGFEGTNVNNVFSLFTGAFNAVGGIFNLKVFGFLPLYWFFLTPIFIAIIALLLRMIKH